MAQTEPWLRFYTETPSDPKLKRAARMIGCKKNVTLATWAAMLTLCKKSPVPGVLMIAKDAPVELYDIDDEAGNEDLELTRKVIDAFISLDMVSLVNNAYSINHWDERQFRSDNSTQRWRDWNEKKKANVGQTLDNSKPQRLTNGPDTESDKEEDTDKEEEKSDPLYPQLPEIALYTEVTGLIPDIVTEQKVVEKVRAIRAFHKSPPHDRLIEIMAAKFSLWKSSTTKDGRPYNPSNPDWLDWCVTGYDPTITAPKKVRKLTGANGQVIEVPV